jgi:hypothetical protein
MMSHLHVHDVTSVNRSLHLQVDEHSYQAEY